MSLFDGIRQRTGIVARLSRRLDDPATWMETYAGISDVTGFLGDLDVEVIQCGIEALASPDAPRKTEVFVEDDLEPRADTACA